jgi:hypothetical protein
MSYFILKVGKGVCTGLSWLTPVLLATQEAKIWRITVQDPSGQKASTYLKNTQHIHTRKGWWSDLRDRVPV